MLFGFAAPIKERWRSLRSERGQVTSFVMILFIIFLVLLQLNLTKIPPHYFFLFFLGIAVFVLAFFRTDFALAILVFSMFFSPEFAVGQVSDRAVVLRFDDIFLMVIFLGWLAKVAVFKEISFLKKTPLNFPILVYVFVSVAATALALVFGKGTFARSLFYLLKYFEYFILYFLVVNNINTRQQIEIFIGLMLLTCLVVSCYALFSYFQTGVRATAPFEGAGGEANTLAGYLVLMIALLAGILLYAESPRLKMGLLAPLIMALLALVFTLSRSGWLSFIFMYVALVFVSKKHKPLLTFGFILMAALAPLLAPKAVQERVAETFQRGGRTYQVGSRSIVIDESGAARIDAWKDAFLKISRNPILGQGIPATSVIDNQYTRVLAETGLVGFWAFGFLLLRIYRAIREALDFSSEDNFVQGIAVGMMAGFFGLLLHCLSAASFIIIRIMEPFWFLMAIVVLLPGLIKPPGALTEDVQGT